MKSSQDKLTLTFTALSDPTRRAILQRLSRGEATVQELSQPFNISGPVITRHLKVLEKAGLISRGRDAQWRPCRIEAQALKDVADWVGEYRQVWEESFDRLDAYLKTITEKGRKNGRKK
jgi:DNA-binding transcriptional ArsR family regulator